jgi:hypothetical protein
MGLAAAIYQQFKMGGLQILKLMVLSKRVQNVLVQLLEENHDCVLFNMSKIVVNQYFLNS